ncbi:hypothetical protein, partial [Campylobacter jejuni]|uniref:hypothetical protein n=1 Tax=Campylobacter jejuni TaxID=197 RepID=UPI002241C149
MLAQEKQDNLDYIYIEKLKTKSERQLKVMLDTLEKETIKIQAEKAKLENKLKDKIKKGHFVKDALMEKWRTPSAELLVYFLALLFLLEFLLFLFLKYQALLLVV